VGWFLLWWYGAAFVLDGRVGGYTWTDQLRNAWMIHHRESRFYDLFREPLYGGTVGALGEALNSYPNSAILVSSMAMVLFVLGVGLTARALAGPAAGGLAAMTVPLVTNVALAARWGNSYPLSGAGIALVLAGGCALARWGRVWMGFAVPAFAFALLVDRRAMLWLPGLLLLGTVGILRHNRKRDLLWLGLFVLVGWTPSLANRYFEVDPVRRAKLDWHTMITTQQAVAKRFATVTPDASMAEACAHQPTDTFWTPNILGTQ